MSPRTKMKSAQFRNLRIEWRPLSALKPNPRNARIHSKKQIHQIAQSIMEFGFLNPVLIDDNDNLKVGHGRFEAAKELGWDLIPTICVNHLSEAQIRAYAIADNKLALKAGWDLEILAAEFQELSELDLPFDLEITGFETAEIDLLIDGPTTTQNDPWDHVPSVEAEAVTRLGDLWHLGQHKLLCADARNSSSYSELMGEERARVVFADPPFNVPIDGHVGGLGSIKPRNFAMACGEMSEAQFTRFLKKAFSNAADVSLDGAIHFICMDWRHIGEVLAAGKAVYAELKNLCVWTKDNGGMGSFYRSQHELVFVFKVGTAAHVNTIELGSHGRYRTNVWAYRGENTFHPGRLEDLAMHPTVKPVALIIDAIKDCSRRGEIVLDPFSGSGSVIIAAERCRRRARAVEIDALYVDVAIRRWEKLTSSQAIHALNGRTFAEMADARREGAQSQSAVTEVTVGRPALSRSRSRK
jgi:16S rRNA G966 N2-methylase RsmD